MKIADIDDSRSLEAYLQTKPSEWSQAIAARIALRVAPIVFRELSNQTIDQALGRYMSLSTFRAIFIVFADLKYSIENTRVTEAAAASSSAYSAAFTAPTSSAITSAVAYAAAFSASDTAASAAASASDSASYTPSIAAAFASDSAASVSTTRSEFWKALHADLYLLETAQKTGLGNAQADGLIKESLWLKHNDNGTNSSTYIPGNVSKAFAKFLQSEIAMETSFGLIAHWYRAAIEGKSAFGEKVELAISQMTPEEWGDGDENFDAIEVMDRVAEIAGWGRKDDHSKTNNAVTENSPANEMFELDISQAISGLQKYTIEHPYGANPIVSGDSYALSFVSDTTDLKIAQALFENGRLELVLEKAQSLLNDARRVENQRAWADLSKVVSRIIDWLQLEPEAMAKRVALAWDLSVTIGTFIELDQKLELQKVNSSDDPLDADIRRRLDDLNVSLSTIIRDFPTGVAQDEQHRAWNESNELLEAAKSLFEEVTEKQLLISDHAEILSLALKSAHINDPQGRKNAAWGSGTIQKLTATTFLIAAGVVAGITADIGGEIASKSGLSQKSADFIISAPDKISELLKYAPPDVRAAHEALMKELPRNF